MKYKDLPEKFKKQHYEYVKDGLEECYESEGDNRPVTHNEVMKHIKHLNFNFEIEIDEYGREYLEIKE